MRRRGFSLIEVLIAGAVGLLLLLVLVMVLTPSLRIWLRTQEDSEAQQAVAVVVARLREEMKAAHPDSVHVSSDPAALLLLSWKGDDGGPSFSPLGEFLWRKRLAIYHRDGEVWVQEEPLPAPATEVEPLRATTFTPGPRDHRIARHIQELTLSRDPVTGVVAVRAVAETVNGRRSTLETSIAPVLAPEATASPRP